MKTVAVITATTLRPEIERTIQSVKEQTYPCQHYVIADGKPFQTDDPSIRVINLPVATGASGYMNGGICAASAFLCTEDYVCWLDDDNWYEPDHVESLIKTIGDGPAAFSLRKLVNVDGSFFDYDNFESVGYWGGLVDVNCYMLRRDLATGFASCWYRQHNGLMIGDRVMLNAMREHGVDLKCSGRYTVNYRLNLKRDLRAYFKAGNKMTWDTWNGKYPWSEPDEVRPE